MQPRPAWTRNLNQPKLLAAGDGWDAVRVSADVGVRAVQDLEARGVPVGPVLHDLCSGQAYFLTPPGSVREWEQDGTRALSTGSWVVLAPPGWEGLLRWVSDPMSCAAFTETDDLAAALTAATEERADG
ncbi:hypothetical protein [Streptomyces melanogenes]|uniref:hypothetical protein n=1 Tax=Streptomyces melanogenes TaxID=67326 RepID=UPI0037B8C90A